MASYQTWDNNNSESVDKKQYYCPFKIKPFPEEAGIVKNPNTNNTLQP